MGLMKKRHVIVIGGGFGGLYVARRLAPRVRSGEIALTLVSRVNYFLFTPLLHEVATGGLTPTSVTEPLRAIFEGSGVRVVQGEAASVDAARKAVRLRDGSELSYDALVVATGAESNDYGVAGAAEHGLPLKTAADAARIRDRVIDAFELASSTGEHERLLSFAVVGGGATGVELAAELAELVEELERAHGFRRGLAKIALVNAGPTLLAQFPEPLRRSAQHRLESLGVDVRNGAAVAAVSEAGIALAQGPMIASATVIWAAGVKPTAPVFEGTEAVTKGGRLVVGADLRVPAAEGVFALGDAAVIEAAPTPMLAQAAVAQAKVVARNVIAQMEGKTLAEFRYRPKGALVSLGRWSAVGEVFSLRIGGRFAWWLWRTIYLFTFASWPKRLRIASEWTIGLFYPRDISKLG